MKFEEPKNTYIQKKCISLCTLYGGYNKNQRKNFVKVPTGSLGTIIVSTCDNDKTEFMFIKFAINGKIVNVKCSPNTVQIVEL